MVQALPDKGIGEVFKTSQFQVQPQFLGGVIKHFLVISKEGTEVFIRCRFLLLDHWTTFPDRSYNDMMELEKLMKGIETESPSNARCRICDSASKHLCSQLLVKEGS